MKNKEVIFIILLLVLSTISFFRLTQTKEEHSKRLMETTSSQETTIATIEVVDVIEGPAVALESTNSMERSSLNEENKVLLRLQELDAEIEKNEGSDVGYSMNIQLESEWKLWQAELDSLMSGLEQVLTEVEFNQLFQEQKDWMKERESKALESSQNKTTTLSEEVLYTLSMCEATRERAYDLAVQYGSLIQ